MKIYFVEISDPYDSKEILGSRGYYDEGEASAAQKEFEAAHKNIYSTYLQDIDVPFSHRNGEKENPEVGGWYWIQIGDQNLIWYVDFWGENGKWLYYTGQVETASFYGPMPFPIVPDKRWRK